jgi:hypothetical protein
MNPADSSTSAVKHSRHSVVILRGVSGRVRSGRLITHEGRPMPISILMSSSTAVDLLAPTALIFIRDKVRLSGFFDTLSHLCDTSHHLTPLWHLLAPSHTFATPRTISHLCGTFSHPLAPLLHLARSRSWSQLF